MKHSNGFNDVRMNVVIKPIITFECLIIKRSYKSHGVKTEKVLLYRNNAIIVFYSKFVLSKTSVRHDKSCFSARAGKTHLC